MSASLASPITAKKDKEPKRRGRRPRSATAGNVRYFVGKPSRNQDSPALEREVPSEAEGLVAAFKTDGSLFVVGEFKVIQQIEGGRVSLVKEPAPATAASPRVSMVNAS